MLRKNRLFTPGPTPLLPAAQTAMASFTAHHRTADFRALFQRVLADMKEFIGTKNDVLVLACSGTGVMEASVSNLTSPGDKSSGAHGWQIRRALDGAGQGLRLQRGVLSAPYGETFSLDDIRAKLTSDVRAVFVQATESSTGARHDVQGIAKIVREQDDTLLVVDAITGLGTTHLDVDGWGVDVIIGGSQKALMMPPGLAYCAVSERAWKRMDATTSPRYYFDCARSASRRRRANRLIRRRPHCLRPWERRWSLSAKWEMATWPRDAKRWWTMPNSARK
jgi:aspartate aminotransferase-like enzyme